jgi:hypothetical protein
VKPKTEKKRSPHPFDDHFPNLKSTSSLFKAPKKSRSSIEIHSGPWGGAVTMPQTSSRRDPEIVNLDSDDDDNVDGKNTIYSLSLCLICSLGWLWWWRVPLLIFDLC